MHGKIRDFVPAENPNKETTIFMGHGDKDPVVRYEWGTRTAEVLKEWGWKVDFRTYPYVLVFVLVRFVEGLLWSEKMDGC